MLKTGSNTTGTISGDLEKVRLENVAEVSLRLARLGPISKFVFYMGRVVMGLLMIILPFAVALAAWFNMDLMPHTGIEVVDTFFRGLASGGVGVSVGWVVGLYVLEPIFDWWHALWLPVRHAEH